MVAFAPGGSAIALVCTIGGYWAALKASNKRRAETILAKAQIEQLTISQLKSDFVGLLDGKINGILQNTIANQRNRIDQVEGERETLTRRLSDTYMSLGHLNAQHVSLNTRHKVLMQRNRDLTQRHSALEAQHVTLAQQHNALNTQHATLTQRHNALDTQHSTLTQRHNALDTRHIHLNERYNSLSQQHSDLCQQHDLTVHNLQSNIAGLRSELRDSLLENEAGNASHQLVSQAVASIVRREEQSEARAADRLRDRALADLSSRFDAMIAAMSRNPTSTSVADLLAGHQNPSPSTHQPLSPGDYVHVNDPDEFQPHDEQDQQIDAVGYHPDPQNAAADYHLARAEQ